MKSSLILFSGLMLAGLLVVVAFADAPATQPSSALNFTVNDINGQPVDLAKYKGKVVLIVNTASKCGLTPQYDALQKLHEKYADKGLAVLGFPCNDFNKQDPGTEADILKFCQTKYHVTFDLFSKVTVKGDEKTPLYQHLISKETNPRFAGEIKWNFTKFLIGRDGQVVSRFEPKQKPSDEAFVKAVETELDKLAAQ